MNFQHNFFELKRYTLEDMASRLMVTKLEIIQLWESKEIDSFQRETRKDSRDIYFYFNYVGVIVRPQAVIHIFPAYLEFGEIEEVKRDYQLALRSIELYKRESTTRETTLSESYSYLDRTKYQKFELMIELLRDYFRDGLYSTERHLYAENGFGEINWDMTIDSYFPLIANNRPIYLTVLTESVDKEDSSIIQRIHRTFIGISYKALRKSGLLELLGFSTYEEHWEPLEAIGSIPYLKRLLQQEMNVEFETRKLYVLETLIALLTEYGKSANAFQTYEFGTRHFAYVWEAACQYAFNNQLNVQLSNLPISKRILLTKNQDLNKRLKDVIEKVKWRFDLKDSKNSFEKDGPIPDIVYLEEIDNDIKMYILDAKYYNVSIGINGVKSVPGFNDVIKQYVYELAFRKFNKQFKIKVAYNAFLFPGLERNKGTTTVEFEPIIKAAKIPLQPLKALEIPAHSIYMSYLESKPLNRKNNFINK